MGMYFDKEAREKMVSGIEKISNAVKSTLGPKGKTVIINSSNHRRGLVVTKDGVTVAKSVMLEDPVENMAVRIMREASENTATSAGDGTTTSIVLAEAIAKAGLEIPGNVSVYSVIKGIHDIMESTISNLESLAYEADIDRVKQIAAISANNDSEIGDIIADTYEQVGKDGVVLVDNSINHETFARVIKGVKIERGWGVKAFVNNHETDSFVADKCRVLLTDVEIGSVYQIENVLREIGKEPLLIIAPTTQQFLATVVANVKMNGYKICVIEPPQFGYKQQELMEDLALITGGVFFSQQTGDDLSLMTMAHLGYAEKVTVERDQTIVIPREMNGDVVNQRVEELRAITPKNPKEKDFINERISYLTGGIGIIYVGGASDVEQKERLDRVDDAVCAVRSAIQGGVIPGGGVALAVMSRSIVSDKSVEGEIAADIMRRAYLAPIKQLLTNAEMKHDDIKLVTWSHGFDIKTGAFVNMMDKGIIDPLKVTKDALRNAVSVATTIMSTNVIIA